MIDKERVSSYIRSVSQPLPPYLEELEAEARHAFIPVVHEETRDLLRVLISIRQPRNILEIGTATGFSTLLMWEYAPDGCAITTIEASEERACAARANFIKSEAADDITLLNGDACELLPGLSGSYDFIFLDAAKGQYVRMLPELVRMLGEGGVLVSDNVLQDGDILESRYVIRQRDRTIHTRMREYLYDLNNTEELLTSLISAGDGITVSVRR